MLSKLFIKENQLLSERLKSIKQFYNFKLMQLLNEITNYIGCVIKHLQTIHFVFIKSVKFLTTVNCKVHGTCQLGPHQFMGVKSVSRSTKGSLGLGIEDQVVLWVGFSQPTHKKAVIGRHTFGANIVHFLSLHREVGGVRQYTHKSSSR